MPTVLITGSGIRIGRALALGFAEKGWDVIVHYNSSSGGAEETAAGIEKMGRKAAVIQADVVRRQEVASAFSKAVKELGHPDVLVNNAGVFPEQRALKDVTTDYWENVMNVNLRGYLYFAQEFAENAPDGSRIVNIGSLGAFEIWEKRIPYHVSKAGVLQLTRALARELAPRISVNCVCPGSIRIPGEPSTADADQPAETRIPMGRYGTTGDVFDAVYFFATASRFITAQYLNIDGGYHDAR